MKEAPEAMNIITKYNILSKFGSAYTFDNIDSESYENIQLMLLCMKYENRAIEGMNNKAQFYQEIGR
jgi:hypothetical protein